MSKEIELLTCPLERTNLIEANAGTGKTYTITALTARMIVEQSRHTIEKILVVTFTKAAAGDLKAKILERLTVLREAFNGKNTDDKFINEYIASCPTDKDTAVKRLSAAVRDFDMNSIFTIHGFCKRMLTENSFSGGIAFDTEMTGDSDEILIKPVQDFWRRNIYPLSGSLAAVFEKDTPESFMLFLKKIQNNPSARLVNCPHVDENELSQIIARLDSAFEEIKQYSDGEIDEVFKTIFPENGSCALSGTSYKIPSIRAKLDMVKNKIRLNDKKFVAKIGNTNCMNLLTDSVVAEKVKAKCTKPEHEFFISMQKWQEAYEPFEDYTKNFRINMLLKLKDYADEVLTAHKLKINSQSYNDLIIQMHRAVMTENSQMTKSLREKFTAALIDEFQDTDPHQYDIFNEIFGKYNLPFFMIGDPKQAIYSFRGADIYTYLKAAAGKDPLTLSNNFRSDALLVEAINRIFGRENSFRMGNIKYFDSKGLKSYPVHIGGEKLKPMTIWGCDKTNKEQIAEACTYKISELLNKGAVIKTDEGERPVRPSDISILTRSRDQAKTVKNSLEKYFIPCVITGSENVFASMQAQEIAKLIQAAVTPYSEKAIRTALATDIFGYDAQMLHDLVGTGDWEQIFEDFISLSELMNRRGVAPMFFQAAKQSGLYKRLASAVSGERKLTNMVHLIELAQKHEAEKSASPNELINWFTRMIEESDDRNEAYELKMDSDDNAVTITTIHKSKGLEYNIVFTPFLIFPKGSRNTDPFFRFHDEDENLVIDFDKNDTAKGKESEENLAEDLRLTYVALTRAKALCYTAWGTTGKDNKNTAFFSLFESNNPADMQKLCKQIENIEMVDMPYEPPSAYAKRYQADVSQNREFKSAVNRPWGINSFSGLLHSTSSVRDTEQLMPTEPETSDTHTIFTFPKGAKAGSCLHEIMENIHPEDPQTDKITEICAEKLEKYGIDGEFVKCAVETVENILTKELVSGITLKGLKDGEFVHEMEFHINTKPFQSPKLAEIFREGGEGDFASSCAVLDFASVQGFLTGFADLIFIRDGKFYVLDWKSNHLGHNTDCYKHENMHEEMLKNHYYLQMYIYTLALHKHLKNCLPDYSYDTHMGGGIYVFMRGVMGGNGVYFHRPPENIITAMDSLMSSK